MISKVAIIILNWNGWEDTIECLESVYQIAYPLYDIILVDNGSKDDSIQKINDYAKGKIRVESKFFNYSQENKPISVKEYSKDKLERSYLVKENVENPVSRRSLILIKNDKNYGFAEGNNIGIKFALNNLNPDYILLLNNDVAVDPYFLNELVSVAEKDLKIGILGPTVYDYINPSEIQAAGTKIYWYIGEAINRTSRRNISASEPEEVDSVIGCALLARSELFSKIGYLNEDYFAYLEETELCVRAHKASYKVIYVPKGKIWHKGGATSNKITGFTVYQITRNNIWLMKEHSSRKQYLSFLIYLFGFRIWYVGSRIFFRQREKEKFLSFISLLKGVKDGILT